MKSQVAAAEAAARARDEQVAKQLQRELKMRQESHEAERIERDHKAQHDRATIESLRREVAQMRMAPGGDPSPPASDDTLCAVCEAPGAIDICQNCNLP
eukprot:10288672-Prorocentrum_lima.AAC.1